MSSRVVGAWRKWSEKDFDLARDKALDAFAGEKNAVGDL